MTCRTIVAEGLPAAPSSDEFAAPGSFDEASARVYAVPVVSAELLAHTAG